MHEHQHVVILLVEDDPGHALLIEKNLRRGNIANQIITLDNGQKAVDFLFKEGGTGKTSTRRRSSSFPTSTFRRSTDTRCSRSSRATSGRNAFP